jgi:hypothetical protein
MNVVATAPPPYFVPAVLGFISEAVSFRVGEQAGQLLVQHAPFLTVDNLQTALAACADNSQGREAAQMPDLAVASFRSTAHLGAGQAAAFVTFLDQVQPGELVVLALDDTEGPALLEQLLQTANDLVDQLIAKPTVADALWDKLPGGVKANLPLSNDASGGSRESGG